MDISAALATDLALLSGLLDRPDVDLEAELRALGGELSAAVSSYLAMTMTIELDGHQVSFTVAKVPDSADGSRVATATSLLIPLSRTADGGLGTALVLFASRPGAFVDLAADLGFALGVGLSELVIDAHIESRPFATGTAGLDELTIVNQALGVLLARGHTPDGARIELRRLADLDGISSRLAAEQIVAGVNRRW